MESFKRYDALPLGIFVLNRDLKILFWNKYLENWTGWPAREMCGADAHERIPALLRPDYRRRLADVLTSGVPAVFSPQLHKPLLDWGPRGAVSATTISALPDPSGPGFLAVVSIQDITDLTRRLDQIRETAGALKAELGRREELEAQLCRAKEAAETASRAKTDFLATVSHEIRTPLHAILGTADLLAESPLDRTQRQQVEMFQRAGRNLLTIINDILDLTKIESGRLDFETIEIDLEEILRDAAALVFPAAFRKGLAVDLHFAPDLETRWSGDPTRIRQVLLNLLGNAVKFTDRGSVRVDARPAAGGEPGMIEISVADTGTGIPSDKLASVFDDFTQADSSTTRRYGGTGLGLSIARRLIEHMGGSIHVTSEPGKGATFTFTMLLRPRAAATPPRPRPVPQALAGFAPALEVLIAEDSEDNQVLMSAFLAKTPHRLTFVNDGREAVEAFSSRCFDLVLMDIQMPVMDGLEATRFIRAVEAERRLPRIPVVAVTASALAHDRQATVAAGCDQHLTKPLSRERLLACLDEFASMRCPAPEAASPIVPRIPDGLEALAATFLDARRKELLRFHQLLALADFDEIRRLGHKLKGAGGGYGFPELTAAGAAIEQAAKLEQACRIRTELGRIQDYLDRVRLPA
ncbi:MAG: ATP-binding protein [Bryobacteraceae bacterium]